MKNSLGPRDETLGKIKEDEEDENFAILEDVEDFEDVQLHHNYDMINIRNRPDDEDEENPFRQSCIKQLQRYYTKNKDSESNPELVIDSKGIFAVDIQIYLK